MTLQPTALWVGNTTTALVSLSLATPLFAQEDAATEVIALDPIYISAYRSNAEAASIPGTVQVITASDLKDRIQTGRGLEAILSDLVPGLSVSNGTVGGASQNLRGRNLQILINGVARTSELRSFDRELGLIDVNTIKRIEVIKGSNAQYGNGATGGTINIVTKQAADISQSELRFGLSAQSENVSDSLGYSVFAARDYRKDNFGLRLELNVEGIGNQYAGNGTQLPSDALLGQGGGDNFDNYSFGLASDYTVGNNRFDLRLDVDRFRQSPEFFTEYLTDVASIDTTAPYTGEDVIDDTNALTLKYSNDALAIGELEVQAYVTDNTRRASYALAGVANTLYYPISTTDLTQDPNSQSELNTTTYGLRSTIRSTLSKNVLLTWGADIGRDDVSQTTLDGVDLIAPMTQNSLALFAQLDAEFGKLELSGGLRYERFDLNVQSFTRPTAALITTAGTFALPALNVTGGNFDYDALVFNLGAVYEIAPTVDVFAGYSQGFSLPDVGAFTRRALAANPFIAGQTVSYADIAPEAQIVDTFEVGLRHQGDRLSLAASAFYATSDEGTVFDSATNTITQQKEETWGAELIADYRVNSDLNLGLSAAFTEGRTDSDQDGEIDSWLPNNRIGAPVKMTLYGDYAFDNGLRMASEIVYTGARDKTGFSEVDETVTVNLRLAKAIGAGEISFGVDNLFDVYSINPTGSSVRTNPLTGDNILVANEGRRVWLEYAIFF